MKKLSFLIAVFIFLATNIFAQDLRKKAEENPLDCALYLLSKDERKSEAKNLAGVFFEVGRYDDALRTIEIEGYGKIGWLVFYASKLSEQGNDAQAKVFLDKTMSLLLLEDTSVNSDDLVFLAPLLIKYGRNEEALSLFNLSEDEYKPKTAIGISKAFLKTNQTENALKLLPAAFEDAEIDRKAEIIELYARLKQTEQAEKFLADFDFSTFLNEPFYHNRRFTLFPLINANLALGHLNRAVELWQQYGENDDVYGWLKFIDALIEFGYREKADFYLTQIESNPAMLREEGSGIVESRLKFGDVEKTFRIAETMSDNDDNYEQQQALMIVADFYIAENKNDAALKVLDFAFERARKIIFQHEDMQSNGASSGTRKVIYLRSIYNRLMKLKQFKKAFTVFNAIGSDHWIAKEFVMESLFDFAKQQIKTLSRKEIEKILKQIQNSIPDRDDDYYPTKAKLFTAEIYALIGEKAKTVRLLTEGLNEGKQSCCYEFGFLLSVGKIFEQNKLKADANLRKVLKSFIEDAE